MSDRPIPKSIHQTVRNMLSVLAQLGDQDAIAALKRAEADDTNVIDDETDDEPESDLKVLIQKSDGTYLITEHGATFVPEKDR